jgi:hypothetical protein
MKPAIGEKKSGDGYDKSRWVVVDTLATSRWPVLNIREGEAEIECEKDSQDARAQQQA